MYYFHYVVIHLFHNLENGNIPSEVIIKGGNSTLNLQTKENLIQALNEKSKKNFSLVKNICIAHELNFGNLIVAFNNLIYYSEILGIKNIYLNNKINWYIKNDINTDKIHISVISRDLINCNSEDTFCFLIGFFYNPIIIKSERRSLILISRNGCFASGFICSALHIL